MPRPQQQIAFQEYVEAVDVQSQRLQRLTQAMINALAGWKWEPVVRALMTLRGVQEVVGMTLVAEAGDLSRFDDPRQLMAFLGLTPSEHTSSDKRWQGGITKCGNNACRRVLTEAAHQYRLPPQISPSLRVRQEKQPQAVRDIAWKAQLRLHHRYPHLSRYRKKNVVIVSALARELVGFVWAIVCQRKAPEKIKARPVVRPAPKFARVIFDGFSIGSNDLTQLILGVDRDSEIVAPIFDERNAAVKKMIAQVIAVCRAKKRKIGICGQAPSDYPDFAQFLVECGIDSISLNPDTVLKTTAAILEKEESRRER